MQSNLLKAKLKENNLTQLEIAQKIGMSLSTFNAKLNGTYDSEFSLGEILAIQKVLKLTVEQTAQIFLN